MAIKNKSRYDIFRDGLTLGEINSIKGVANGIASLDSGAKVPLIQLPDSITGAVYYKGSWDCSVGTYPTSPNTGDYYICSVEGTIGAVDYLVSDWLIYNGSTWDKIDNSYGHDHDYRYYTIPELNDTTSNQNGSILIGYPTIDSPTLDNIGELTQRIFSTGRITGGEITDNGDNTFDVASGSGLIKATDVDTAELLSFEWSTSSDNAMPAESARYIGVEYNAGVPQVVVKTTDTWDYDTEFPLGNVIRNDSMHILNNPWWVGDILTNLLERHQAHGKFARDDFIGGLMLSVSGTRNIAVTAGAVWTHINEFVIHALDTNVTGAFKLEWVDTSNGWTETSETQYSVTQWNDLAEDTLQTIPNNDYANIWVFIDVDKQGITVLYPQAVYSNSAEAEAEAPPITTIPQHLSLNGMLLGRIIIQQGNDTPIKTEVAWDTTFSASLSADHGNLAGLTDDDHTQYSLVTGTRAFTGVVGGVTPTADAHLATKGYVDGLGIFTPSYGALKLNTSGTLEVTTAGTYYRLDETNIVGSVLNNLSSNITMSDANGTFTIVDSGIYEVNASFSFSGTGGALVHIDPFIDNVEVSDGGMERKLGVGGDVGSGPLSDLLSLTAGEVLDFRVTSDDNGDDVTFQHISIVVKRIA